MYLFITGYCLIVSLSSVAATQKIIPSTSIQKQLSEFEDSSKGRIGVYAINTANNAHLSYRANERFPTGCTSKALVLQLSSIKA